MITVYGRVTEIEPTEPGGPPVEPDPPPIRLKAFEWESDTARFQRELRNELRTVIPQVGEEGDEPPKNWVHVHIVLDPPHAGELELNTPEGNVTGVLAVGGRARVMLSAS